MKPRIKATQIKPDMTIKKVMQIIQAAPHKADNVPGHVALALGKNNKLYGIVTDGDIRKALLKGAKLSDSIKPVINTNPITFNKDLSPEQMLEKTIEAIKSRSKKRLDIIITVDSKNKPYDIMPFFELWQSTEVKTRVISIIGLGYVGLTLGLILADTGFKVIGVDKVKSVIDRLNHKKSHIHEPGIINLLHRNHNKNFFVQHKFDNNDSDVYIICVGTPVNERGQVIFHPLKDALRYITKILKKGDLVILRSTVPIGTCHNLVIPYLEKHTKLKAGEDFFVAFAPERTLEGDALNELRTLPQVIGGYNKRSTDLAIKLFSHLTNSIVGVDNLETAEMVKLLNNSYRDLTFAFANEAAIIADKFNLNSQKVIQAANSGYARSLIPCPSPGVGGYCLSKDPFILIESARQKKYQAKLPLLSRQLNNQMINYVCQKVHDFFLSHNKEKNKFKIFVIGLAFKGEPETADMRHSTSLKIIDELKKRYPKIYAYDPVIKRSDIVLKGLRYLTLKQGFRHADSVLFLNNHSSYKEIDIYNYLALMNKPGFLFDGWHMFSDIINKPLKDITYRGI